MRIKPFLLALTFLMILASCEDFIDVDQPDIIEQEQAFDDKNSTRLSMIGIYGLMTELVEPMFLAGEVRADLVTANESANTYIKEFSNNSYSPSNPYISPKPFYKVINNANDFILEFKKKLVDQEIDTATFIKYKSELVAIRVWTQYQVSKIFGKCKYYTEVDDISVKTDIPEYSYSDTSFLRMLVNDLAYSDTNNYSPNIGLTIWVVGTISDFYVNVIMAELLMDMGLYEQAFDKFEEVTDDGDAENKIRGLFNISAGDFDGPLWMENLFDEEWENNDLLTNTPFILAFDNKYNQSNELWNWTLSLDYQIVPTAGFYNQFNTHAFADPENTDYRVLSVRNPDRTSDRSYAISKYQADDRPYIMTRTARIELQKAYCLSAMDENAKALKLIKKIRSRVDYPEIDDDLEPEDDDPNVAINWLQDIIIDELAYETCFEGQRWWDLVREANRRNDPSYLANRVAAKYPTEIRNKIKAKLLNKENWYVPVY